MEIIYIKKSLCILFYNIFQKLKKESCRNGQRIRIYEVSYLNKNFSKQNKNKTIKPSNIEDFSYFHKE